ncbi:MAG TPA: hypothetical protein VFW40_10845 [Capsulimonadaceae bacterium]|nr:hypothetical protein [Capsulimonadaceae bacterium]
MESIHGDAQVGIAGEHDPDGVCIDLLGLLQELDAIHTGHGHVRDNDGVGPFFPHEL